MFESYKNKSSSNKLEKFRSNIRKETIEKRFSMERNSMIKRMDLETLESLLGKLGETEQPNFSYLSQVLHLFEENVGDFKFTE